MSDRIDTGSRLHWAEAFGTFLAISEAQGCFRLCEAAGRLGPAEGLVPIPTNAIQVILRLVLQRLRRQSHWARTRGPCAD